MIKVDDADTGKRLDLLVAEKLDGFSRSRVQKLIESGNVLVNGQVEKAKYLAAPGDSIEVTVPAPDAALPKPEAMDINIVFEDNDLIVINKPAGLVVHPGAGAPDGTLVNGLLARHDSLSSIGGVLRPGIIHRLDKDTSGLLIVAKNDFSHQKLSEALVAREVVRIYWALVMRKFEKTSGVVEATIGRHRTVRTRMAVSGLDARDARTHWKVLESFHNFSLLECRLETGRTHQIRVHLSHIRHPIVGDSLYEGGPELAQQLTSPNNTAQKNALRLVTRQMLHARELRFRHPRTADEHHYIAEPPDDFMAVLHALREGAKSPGPAERRY